jgi:hypothetical protein
VVDVDLAAIGDFYTSEDAPDAADAPDWVRRLDGRRVRLRGQLLAVGDLPAYPMLAMLMPEDDRKWNRVQAAVLCNRPDRWLRTAEIGDTVSAVGVLHVGLVQTWAGDALFRLDVETMERHSRLESLPFYGTVRRWLNWVFPL